MLNHLMQFLMWNQKPLLNAQGTTDAILRDT